MATLLPNGKQTFLDQNGDPLTGGSVAFYVPGTSTLKDTFRDAGATILNTNPVILDGAGQAQIYGAGAYRQVVKDALGNIIWDQLTADTASTTSSWASVSTGTANSQIVSAPNFSSQDGQAIDFIAGLTNTGAFSLRPNGSSAIPVKKDTVSGSVNLTGGEIVAGCVYHAVYDAGGGVLHLAYAFDKGYVDTKATLGAAANFSTLSTSGSATFGGTVTSAAGLDIVSGRNVVVGANAVLYLDPNNTAFIAKDNGNGDAVVSSPSGKLRVGSVYPWMQSDFPTPVTDVRRANGASMGVVIGVNGVPAGAYITGLTLNAQGSVTSINYEFPQRFKAGAWANF